MATPKGMAPAAWAAYQLAAKGAGINLQEHPKLRLTQTLGYATASAGVHESDGTVMADGAKRNYCAASDWSVLWLSLDEIKAWLNYAAWYGWAAWYRPWTTNGKPNFHIHAIYAGLPMKPALESQVIDFLNDRNGLKGHGPETFFTGNAKQDAYIRALFNWSNRGGDKPPAPPLAPKAPPPPVMPMHQTWDVILSGRERQLDAVLLDGKAWLPVREWYAELGITVDSSGRQLVKWAPAESAVYVQGRKLPAEIKLLRYTSARQKEAKRTGFAKAEDLVKFSGLGLTTKPGVPALYVGRP